MYNRRMDNIFKAGLLAWSLLIAAAFIGGCGDAGSPVGPPPPPPPPVQGAAPVVSSISPADVGLNGAWFGFPGNGDDRGMSFTVENGRLVRASCDDDIFAAVSISLEGPVAISNGEFSNRRRMQESDRVDALRERPIQARPPYAPT